jgi:hypothetical protein
LYPNVQSISFVRVKKEYHKKEKEMQRNEVQIKKISGDSPRGCHLDRPSNCPEEPGE